MKPILISGAGLGGLLLARSLKSSNIPFELYERDAHVAARGQGYRLRISTDGLNALESVLTESEYADLRKGTTETGGGGIHNLDALTAKPSATPSSQPAGDKTKQGPGLGGNVLGAARTFLRSELIKGLESSVHWNKQSTGYIHRHSDSVQITFADGTHSPEGSLLVAADGPHSAINHQLTDGKVKTYDTGARMIHGQTRASAFAELGEGVWFALDAETLPDGGHLNMITNVRPGSFDTTADNEEEEELGWVLGGSPGSFDAPDGNFSIKGQVAADLSRQLTAKWHPSIRAIFEQQNSAEAAFLKVSTASPDGVPEWENDSRVTVLGDAVHCMTPAGGVGANTALRDAALLGGLIKEANGWKEGLTNAYEQEMRQYAGENVKMSFEQMAKRWKIKELK